MIRDSSDGSVRESDVKNDDFGMRSKEIDSAANSLILTSTSGLPLASTKPENIARLERSRKQLEYFRKTGEWNDAT